MKVSLPRVVLVLMICATSSLLMIFALCGAVAFGVLALATCSNLADVIDSLDYTTCCPDKADLVGTWEPTEETLRAMAREGIPISRHQLILHADDTVEMRNIPGNWRSHGERMGEPADWKGTWTLDADDSFCSISLVDGERTWVCAGCLLLLGQHPPYKAGLAWGIAEPLKRMEFSRVNGEPAGKGIPKRQKVLSDARGRS